MRENKKILLVDDEHSILQTLSELIVKQFGPIVEVATSAVEAMKKLEKSKDFHVVVSDYNMPDGNGLELANYMESKNLRSYFILFSGEENLLDLELSDRVIHIQKPNVEKLLQTLEILP